jgi:hypothetical protein
MNWDALGAIGEVVGALAVVLTLGYLAIQIRQNSKAVRSSTRSDIAKMQLDINFMLSQNPDTALALYAFWRGDELDEREETAAIFFVMGMFRTMENQFFAYLEGNFSASVWKGYRANIVINVRAEQFDKFWEPRRELFSSEFAEFIDGLLHEHREGTLSTT